MLRVNSSDVLVVPPFECAWVEKALLRDSAGCITFEAQGANDATLILKSKPGSKRWQHMELGAGDSARGGGPAVDHNYTVIFGSHQNTCLKIEKSSQECFRVELPDSVRGSSFVSCWVNYDNGSFQLGTGEPGSAPCYSWSDPDPIPDIKHVGLGTWDKHMCFRNIRTHASLTRGGSGSSVATQARLAEAANSNVPSLASICERAVVEGVSPSTVCSALSLVDLLSPSLDGAAPALVSHLARHLVEVLEADARGFQSLPAGLVAEMLGNPCLGCRERVALDAVERWAYGGTPQPGSGAQLVQSLADVEGLLLLIRFPLMSQTELEGLRDRDLAQRSPLLGELLSEASDARMHSSLEMQAGGGLAVEGKRNVRALDSPPPRTPAPGSPERFRRQHAPASKHLMFVSHGDGNGLSKWLGTTYGTQNWVNPVLAGMMQVHASSPSCKHTDPKALVGGNFLRLNMAGPGRSGTWWQIDLGKHHRLICNYYTLRHDASHDFPRDWVLQASTDGNGWVDLRRHRGDFAISMPCQGASFPVSGHAASMPYRLFRTRLTAPTAGTGAHRNSLHLSLFELYGHFFRIQ